MSRLLVLAVLCAALAAPTTFAQPPKTFLGKNAATWAAQLQDDDIKFRRNAAFALAKLGADAVPQLAALRRAAMNDGDPEVREAAVAALGDIAGESVAARNDEELLPTLLKCLSNDKTGSVRAAAVAALGAFPGASDKVTPPLLEAARDSSAQVRQAAMRSLGKTKHVAALPGLRGGLTDLDRLVVRDAIAGIRELEAEARPALAEVFALRQHSDAEIRRNALAVLSGLLEPSDAATVAAPLAQSLQDPDREARCNAALALCRTGEPGKAALPLVLEMLKDAQPQLRAQAALGCSALGIHAKTAVPQLVQALHDRDKSVREATCVALAAIGPDARSATSELAALFADRKEAADVRVHAGIALQKLGQSPEAMKAKPNIMAVAAAAKDPPEVRERALWAMRVHGLSLAKDVEFLTTLGGILSEPKTDEAKMLRYDAAYLLGMLKAKETPKAALDTLLDYLRDEKVLIYTGPRPDLPKKIEYDPNAAKIIHVGYGDGRIMAMDALRQVGADVIRSRPDIANQIKALAETARDANLKAKCKDTVERFELK